MIYQSMWFSFLFLCCNGTSFFASWQNKVLGEADFEPVVIKWGDQLEKKQVREVFVTDDFSSEDLVSLSQASKLRDDQYVLVVRDNAQINPPARDAKGYKKTCQYQVLNDAVVVGAGITLRGFGSEQPDNKLGLAIKWALIGQAK